MVLLSSSTVVRAGIASGTLSGDETPAKAQSALGRWPQKAATLFASALVSEGENVGPIARAELDFARKRSGRYRGLELSLTRALGDEVRPVKGRVISSRYSQSLVRSVSDLDLEARSSQAVLATCEKLIGSGWRLESMVLRQSTEVVEPEICAEVVRQTGDDILCPAERVEVCSTILGLSPSLSDTVQTRTSDSLVRSAVHLLIERNERRIGARDFLDFLVLDSTLTNAQARQLDDIAAVLGLSDHLRRMYEVARSLVDPHQAIRARNSEVGSVARNLRAFRARPLATVQSSIVESRGRLGGIIAGTSAMASERIARQVFSRGGALLCLPVADGSRGRSGFISKGGWLYYECSLGRFVCTPVPSIPEAAVVEGAIR